MSQIAKAQFELWGDKIRFMESLRGGVIFCAYTSAQALICEKVGAKAIIAVQTPIIDPIMHVEKPVDTTDASNMSSIMDCVVLPVFAKIRIGHETEAHIMQEVGVNGILEFHPMFGAVAGAGAGGAADIYGADLGIYGLPGMGVSNIGAVSAKKANAVAIPDITIPKREFAVPFICGVENLGDAIKHISEGASMLYTNGKIKDVATAIGILRTIKAELQALVRIKDNIKELTKKANDLDVNLGFVQRVATYGKLPIPLFGYGGVKNPSDAAFLKSTGCDGIIVGAEVLDCLDAQRRAYGIVLATKDPKNYKMLAGISNRLGVE